MLSDQRQSEISDFIYREGKASISELAEIFNVSCETIRRDLITISRSKQIRKVHGGAVAVKPPILDKSYAVRQTKNSQSKEKIGQRAAMLINDNDIIGLDSGTCSEALAKSIHGVRNVTFIVHSRPVATILAQKMAAGDFTGSIVVLTGTVNPESLTITGMHTLSQLKSYHMNKSFLAATAVSEDGLMAGLESDGLTSSLLINQSESSYILAESEKFGQKSLFRFAEFDEVTAIITDSENPINHNIKKNIAQNGAEIITAQ